METAYYIIGLRPVKGVKESDGSYGIYAFSWETGEFEINYEYLERIVAGDKSGETEVVTKEQFEVYVEKLRKEKGFN